MSENSERVAKKKTAKKKVAKKTVKKQAARGTTVKKKVAKKQVPRKKAVARTQVSDEILNQVSHRERYEMIASMAYFRAEKRSFEPGWEQEDWYASEKIVEEMLNKNK